MKLSKPRLLLLLIVLPFYLANYLYAAEPAERIDSSSWEQFLSMYVQEGLVDYKEAKRAGAELAPYFLQIEKISIFRIDELNREKQMAFWINLYNAGVVRQVLQHYPLKSVSEIEGFGQNPSIQFLDSKVSLDEVKDKFLRHSFRDVRVLFVLANGRMDGPRLDSRVFHSDTLERDLDVVSRRFVEDSVINKIIPGEKKIFLSPIFREYGADFLLSYGNFQDDAKASMEEGAVIGFIIDHMRTPEKRLFLADGNFKVGYLPEDARLNEKRS